MKLILDTSALLSGLDFPGAVYVPSSVVQEAGVKGLDSRTASFLDAKARVWEPRAEDLEAVSRASRATGDEQRLSPVDRDVLALALQLQGIVITDDYTMQNVATQLGLEYRPAVLPGIRTFLSWSFRCVGCGRYWPEAQDSCPVCGATVRRTRTVD